MYKILFNRKKCTGCSYCCDILPQMWTLNNADGKADLFEATKVNEVFFTQITDNEYKQNFDISKICPSKVIQLKKL